MHLVKIMSLSYLTKLSKTFKYGIILIFSHFSRMKISESFWIFFILRFFLKICVQVWSALLIILVQLNQFETAPYFHQLSENLTLDCLLIYLNFPEFPSSCMMWSKNCSEDQNKTILWSHHARTWKFR